MGLLGGDGFSLPVISDIQVVKVSIDVTESAINKMKQTMAGDEETHCLIISAQSGGCSGYLYDMQIVEIPETDGFQELVFDGIRVFVHNKDSALLNGIILDYNDTLMNAGFIIKNPNASRECGCGQSFG